MQSRLRLFPSFFVAAALAVVFFSVARAQDGVSTIKFSDPAKPGTLKVTLGHGNLRVTGTDTTEVAVKSSAKAATKAVRTDGLRVLTAASSYGLTEKHNVVTLDAVSDSFGGKGADFTITVPRNTGLTVQSSWGGDITCTDVAGDLEIKNMSGEVHLDGVRGGVLVETMSGEIRANILELKEGRPLSFTSMNGEVVLRVPGEAKANVRLRTQNGSVLTDFDDTALITKTESAPRTNTRRIAVGTRSPKPPKAPAAATGPEAPAAPLPPVEGVLDASTKEEIRETVRASIRAGAEVAKEAMSIAREAVQAARDGMAEAGMKIPPMPPIPTISGGKLVTGTLNGGGPEISVATMNGDVTLRQLEAKK
jgi:hypothetical protein